MYVSVFLSVRIYIFNLIEFCQCVRPSVPTYICNVCLPNYLSLYILIYFRDTHLTHTGLCQVAIIVLT